MATEAEWAYFAGIIDGEGSICAHSNNGSYPYNYPSVHVSNTSVKLIDWIRERFGGRLSRQHKGRKKLYFQLMWAGKSQVPVLEGVLPFLVVKKEQAEIVLAFRKLLASTGGKRLSEEELFKREALAEALGLLNHADDPLYKEKKIEEAFWNNFKEATI